VHGGEGTTAYRRGAGCDKGERKVCCKRERIKYEGMEMSNENEVNLWLGESLASIRGKGDTQVIQAETPGNQSSRHGCSLS